MAACNWSLNGCSTEGESGNDGLVRSDGWQMVPVPSYCGNDSAMRAERAFTSHDASKRAASRISTERTITLLCSLSSLVDQPVLKSSYKGNRDALVPLLLQAISDEIRQGFVYISQLSTYNAFIRAC